MLRGHLLGGHVPLAVVMSGSESCMMRLQAYLPPLLALVLAVLERAVAPLADQVTIMLCTVTCLVVESGLAVAQA